MTDMKRWVTVGAKERSVERTQIRGKETPIIHSIQKSVMCGRHRFSATKHAEAYKEFANALIKNPDCMRFLKDQGANDAPPEFLAAVEKVFRAVALKDKFSMGQKVMSSRKWWRQRLICLT